MALKNFVIKGDICYSESLKKIECVENGYVVCLDGKCAGVFETLPEKYASFEVVDCTGKLVMPGMVDLHIHAPQFAFRGLGMDLELLEWLKKYTFPEEAKYADVDYAEKAYGVFANRLKNSATTRASIFATIHNDATIMLMDMLEEAGLCAYVGKVNMDTDAPDDLREESAYKSAFDTFKWVNNVKDRYKYVKPILTPRFLPSCSHTLMSELSEVQKAFGLPVQSHLSENPGEVELVKRLYPKAAFYGDGYDRYGLFGKTQKTIMAHCIYCTPEEIDRIKENGVYVAHCAASNMNLSSGIAPIRKYVDMGIRVGIGTDVAGGESESMFRAVSDAVQVSKLYWRLVDNECAPLTFDEAFYLATVGGGDFFGKVGTFKEDYEFDAVVIDDYDLSVMNNLSVRNRLERAVYLEADSDKIVKKYVGGREIVLKSAVYNMLYG